MASQSLAATTHHLTSEIIVKPDKFDSEGGEAADAITVCTLPYKEIIIMKI